MRRSLLASLNATHPCAATTLGAAGADDRRDVSLLPTPRHLSTVRLCLSTGDGRLGEPSAPRAESGEWRHTTITRVGRGFVGSGVRPGRGCRRLLSTTRGAGGIWR